MKVLAIGIVLMVALALSGVVSADTQESKVTAEVSESTTFSVPATISLGVLTPGIDNSVTGNKITIKTNHPAGWTLTASCGNDYKGTLWSPSVSYLGDVSTNPASEPTQFSVYGPGIPLPLGYVSTKYVYTDTVAVASGTAGDLNPSLDFKQAVSWTDKPANDYQIILDFIFTLS